MEKITGWHSIVLGSIIMTAAIITLIRIHGIKNVRFLRYMLIILVTTSAIELIEGSVILKIINITDADSIQIKGTYLALIGLTQIIYGIGMYSIMWFTSFKYWTTTQQFSRVLRSMTETNEEKVQRR